MEDSEFAHVSDHDREPLKKLLTQVGDHEARLSSLEAKAPKTKPAKPKKEKPVTAKKRGR